MTASTRRRSGDDRSSRDTTTTGGFHRRPSAIVCQGCGGQYFAASLPIHQKTCFERNPFVDVSCPQCRSTVKSGWLRDHVSTCKGILPISDGALVAKTTTKPAVSPEELNAPEPDGRVRCRTCDRAFHAERIAKHQSVCAGTRRRVPAPATSQASTKSTLTVGRVRSPAKTASPRPTRRPSTYVARIRNVSAVSMKFAGAASASPATVSPGLAWGRPGETSRFDLVHRDGARRFEASARLHLSTSTATSASNPLATSSLMTRSSWP